jgi:hypothetical protein
MTSTELPLKSDAGAADTRPVRRLVTLVTAAVVCSIGAAGAPAATGSGASFALTPVHYDPSLPATKSYFVAVGRPGATIRNSVRVVNTGSERGTAYLSAVDATTGQTSGAVYDDRRITPHGVGAWVSLSAHSVTLAPKESRVVDVVVRVPRRVHPGDHLGGIVAENAQLTESNGKGALQIRIRHLTIAAVEVQVPGRAAPAVVVSGVRAGGRHGWQYVYVHLRNLGSLTTRPTARLVLADSQGTQIASRTLHLDTFLPGTEIDYPVLLPKQALSPGRYRATVDLTYAASALGYRRHAGPSRTISRTFELEVTSSQYTSVFAGVPAVSAPAQRAPSEPGGHSLMLFLVAGVIGLLCGALVLAFGIRRWRPSH